MEESQILSGCGGAGGDEKMVLTPHLQTHISWQRLHGSLSAPLRIWTNDMEHSLHTSSRPR